MYKACVDMGYDNRISATRSEARTYCPSEQFHGMVGQSQVMKKVFDDIRTVGPSDFSVLITGETGTGKELAARAVHEESRRQKGPFVPVNCGALPESVLESELFGHVSGAFTGAVRRRKGRFELADRGTLFLDEVADLSLSAQVKLLRVLDGNPFMRVGGEETVAVDVRIVSATNRDLREKVRRGRFREDLFYRLSVVPIRLSPLSDRKGDVPLIAQHVVDIIRQKTGKPLRFIGKDAMAALEAQPWPGNIRHLMSALKFASIRCDGETIHREHLPPWDNWLYCRDD